MSKKRKTGLDYTPHQAKYDDRSCGAWWYENQSHIDVLIQPNINGVAQNPVSCKISRRSIEAWLRRTSTRNKA